MNESSKVRFIQPFNKYYLSTSYMSDSTGNTREPKKNKTQFLPKERASWWKGQITNTILMQHEKSSNRDKYQVPREHRGTLKSVTTICKLDLEEWIGVRTSRTKKGWGGQRQRVLYVWSGDIQACLGNTVATRKQRCDDKGLWCNAVFRKGFISMLKSLILPWKTGF